MVGRGASQRTRGERGRTRRGRSGAAPRGRKSGDQDTEGGAAGGDAGGDGGATCNGPCPQSGDEGEGPTPSSEQSSATSLPKVKVAERWVPGGCAKGFDEDVERLIMANWVQMKKQDLASFMDLWREKRFYKVYKGRQTHAQLQCFTEAVYFHLLYCFLNPQEKYNMMKIRAAYLFLLYEMYLAQPVPVLTKIRISSDTYKSLRKLTDQAFLNGLKEPRIILEIMLLEKCFMESSLDRLLGHFACILYYTKVVVPPTSTAAQQLEETLGRMSVDETNNPIEEHSQEDVHKSDLDMESQEEAEMAAGASNWNMSETKARTRDSGKQQSQDDGKKWETGQEKVEAEETTQN